MVKAHANRPIVRKRRGFLSNPLRVHGITGLQHRQIAHQFFRARLYEKQLGRVLRIALDASPRGFIEAVELRSIPPRGVSIRRSSGRAAKILLAAISEAPWWAVVGDLTFVDSIVRTAVELLDLFSRKRPLDIVHELGCASHCD